MVNKISKEIKIHDFLNEIDYTINFNVKMQNDIMISHKVNHYNFKLEKKFQVF